MKYCISTCIGIPARPSLFSVKSVVSLIFFILLNNSTHCFEFIELTASEIPFFTNWIRCHFGWQLGLWYLVCRQQLERRCGNAVAQSMLAGTLTVPKSIVQRHLAIIGLESAHG